jgi:hypothetical protein
LNIKPQIGLYISTLGSLHSCTFLTFQYQHLRASKVYQKDLLWCTYSTHISLLYSLLLFFTVDFTIFVLDSAISPYGTILKRPRSHYPSLYEDLEDWTPIVRVTRGTPVYLRDDGLIFRDEQLHDITPLLPLDLSAAAPLTHLLGKEMIDGEALDGPALSSAFRSNTIDISWIGPAASLHGRGTFFAAQVCIAVSSC